jgi:3-hydroxyisobutyrate dehydrogenase-like beta-hydroxyacid dehydrogenase
MPQMKIAFLGLGVMGAPMAGHLSAKGYHTTVWNRSRAKSQQWLTHYQGSMSETAIDAVKNASCVMMCLGNDESVDNVTRHLQDGILDHMKAGALLIDHTTASADLARRLYHDAKKRGIGFLDAPVSGGQAGAKNAQLTIMCGGDEADFEAAKPIMESYASKIRHLGASGNGQLCKMVNQICIAGLVQALAEGVNFALKSGLDAYQVFETISSGAAGSWQMNNRHAWMIESDFQDNKGFAIDWMRKDLAMCFEEAAKHNVHLPVTQLVDTLYQELQSAEKGRLDTSALIERLK